MAASESKPELRILVTGGAGFIGSAFVRRTLIEYPQDQVIVLDKLTYAGNPENLREVRGNPRFSFVRGDISDPDVVGGVAAGVDAIVNFAAETHVDRSILDAGEFVKTDVHGSWVLAEAAREMGVGRFVQVSTDEVYGSVDTGASRETDRLDPSSPYSASKAGGELMIISYHKTHRLPALVVRGANAYGPYQYPEKLIPLHVTNGIDSQPLPIYGDGQQRRQWTHVEDFVDGVDTVLRKGRVGEIYNIGNPETDEELAPNLTVTRRILELLGKPESLISYVTDRPAHDRRYRVDMSKLLGIGWQPRWTFAAGLEQTVRWYQDNDWWWRPIKSGDYRRYYEDNYENRERFAAAGGGSEGSR